MGSRLHRDVLAAFDHGQVPTIACINSATSALGVDFSKLIVTLQKFVNECFVPVWGTPCRLVEARTFVPGAWAIVFLESADVQGALGYHDLTPDGLPLGKIFVKTTLGARQKVSVTACHELAEMLVDPATNLCAVGPKGLIYAYETADAVEQEEFEIDGIAMSDFVYPAYFEGFRKSGSAQFDFLKRVRKPFEILRGGYMPVFSNGQWTQIFGSKAKESVFRKHWEIDYRTKYRANPAFRRSAARDLK